MQSDRTRQVGVKGHILLMLILTWDIHMSHQGRRDSNSPKVDRTLYVRPLKQNLKPFDAYQQIGRL